MKALIDSMRWDEEVYGLEYDLDLFNIVAVAGLQRGCDGEQGPQRLQHRAMFWPDPETATDARL
jgi:aminopeptidase N